MLILRLISVLFLSCNLEALVLGINPMNMTLKNNSISHVASSQSLKDEASFATAVVNTQVLTIFTYQDSQIYVYSALSNEKENLLTPQKWIFYFVPIMLPFKTNNGNSEWAFAIKNEIRINLMLSNADVEESVRKAIVKKYDLSISQYSTFWDVAPLMIDSLMAYIVRGAGSLVEGVHPYKAIHPNQLTIQFRFYCSSEHHAKELVGKIIDNSYEIEVAFYFAGFKQVKTNLISITSDQLNNVLSKTIADGGNKNGQYIHRNQATSFVSKHVTNVKKMVYMEDPNPNTTTSLSFGLEDQFTSLFQQGIASSDETKIDAKLFDQVWSSADLNPDLITSELSKIFIYNKSESERHNYSDNFFNLNRTHMQSSSSSGGGRASIFGTISLGGSGASSSSFQDHLMTTTKSIFSQTDIQHLLSQESIETSWTGEKFIPKSFGVYRLTDITDRLQIAIIAKQLIAEKANGAIVRIVNTRTITPPFISSKQSEPLIGEIKLYSANESFLPQNWILCRGQAISRIKYQRLFSVIRVSFGIGDGKTTFNVPDFRQRFPLGLDPGTKQVPGLNKGGSATQMLTIAQIPAHRHGKGTLYTVNAGEHNHSVNDPGHNHGGKTDSSVGGAGGYNMKPNGGGSFHSQVLHSHIIPSGKTGIELSTNGTHSHLINGTTDSIGLGQPFSIMPPYQIIDYIIFVGND